MDQDDYAHSEEEQTHEETQDEGIAQGAEPTSEIGVSGEQVRQEKKKRERKEPVVLVREVGKSLLPFARVQKIIKADKVCVTDGFHELIDLEQ